MTFPIIRLRSGKFQLSTFNFLDTSYQTGIYGFRNCFVRAALNRLRDAGHHKLRPRPNYGLGAAEIREIELWFCRRYERLARGQGVWARVETQTAAFLKSQIGRDAEL